VYHPTMRFRLAYLFSVLLVSLAASACHSGGILANRADGAAGSGGGGAVAFDGAVTGSIGGTGVDAPGGSATGGNSATGGGNSPGGARSVLRIEGPEPPRRSSAGPAWIGRSLLKA